MQAVMDGGYLFTQQFDPFTGEPSIVSPVTKEVIPPDSDESLQDAYGPTLLPVLTYMTHMWGVAMVRWEIWFSMGSGEKYTGECVCRIVSGGRYARAWADGCEIYNGWCGVRLVTNKVGKLLYQVDIK